MMMALAEQGHGLRHFAGRPGWEPGQQSLNMMPTIADTMTQYWICVVG